MTDGTGSAQHDRASSPDIIRTVVITGATGNLGTKLRRHLEAAGRYRLRLTDLHARGDPEVVELDLSDPGSDLRALLAGADAIVHLAGDPDPTHGWPQLTAPNVDAVLNLFLAAAAAEVRRIVLASSVWAVAGQFGGDAPIAAGPATPGNNAYGASKLFAERIGAAFAASHGIATVALRIGACVSGANPRRITVRPRVDPWLHNDDLCHGVECALEAPLSGLVVANLVSAPPVAGWSLDEARDLIGYAPPLRYDIPIIDPARPVSLKSRLRRFAGQAARLASPSRR